MPINPDYLKKTTATPRTSNPLDYISKKKAATPDNYQTAYSKPAPTRQESPFALEIDKIAGPIEQQAAEKQKKQAGIWNTYSKVVNEVAASANRGIGISATMFGSALKFMGKKNEDKGLWKAYSSAGKWLEDAGGNMSELLTTNEAARINELFADDPVAAIKDPWFYATKIGEVAVPSAVMMAPGAAIGGATASVGFLSKAPTVAKFIFSSAAAAGVSRPIESMAEAGETYNQAKIKGFTEEESVQAGTEVFKDNLNLLGLDAFQFGLVLLPQFKYLKGLNTVPAKILVETIKHGAGAATEGGEEIYQLYIQKKALGEDFDVLSNESKQSFILGALGGVIFQAAGKAMTAGEKKESEEGYVKEVIKNLPPEHQTEFTPEMTLDEELASLERLAEQSPEIVEPAIKAIDEQHIADLNQERAAGEAEAAKAPSVTPDDILSEIQAAAATVATQKPKTPETTTSTPSTDVLADIPESLQAEAEQVWEDKYADSYGELEQRVQQINKELKTAKAAEQEKLKEEQADLVKQQVAQEQELLSSFDKKVKEAQSKKIADDVEKVTAKVDEVKTVKVADPDEQEAMRHVNPALYKLALKANTVDEFIEAVAKSASKSVKDIETKNLKEWYPRVLRPEAVDKTASEADNVGNGKKPSDNNSRGSLRQDEDTTRDRESSSEPRSAGKPSAVDSERVARGEDKPGSRSLGERLSDSVEFEAIVRKDGQSETVTINAKDKKEATKLAKALAKEEGSELATTYEVTRDLQRSREFSSIMQNEAGLAEEAVTKLFLDHYVETHAYPSENGLRGFILTNSTPIGTSEKFIKQYFKDNYNFPEKTDFSTTPEVKIKATDTGEVTVEAKGKKTTEVAIKQKNKLAQAAVDFVTQEGSSLSDASLYIKKEIENFMPLQVERISGGPFGTDLLTIRHTYIQAGDVMFDPEVVFKIEKDGSLTALSIETSPYGQKDIKPNDPFLKMWAQNLYDQGFIENKKKPAKVKEQTPGEVNRGAIRSLEADLRAVYLGTEAIDGMEGYNKADEVLSQMLVALEIAEAGSRLVMDNGEVRGISSTFPEWVPDNARHRDDLDYAIQAFGDVRGFAYPAGKKETKRRGLANALFEELDHQLGVDTSVIRNNILDLYEEADTITKKRDEAHENGNARGAVETEERTGYTQEELEHIISDAAYISAEGEVLFTNGKEPTQATKKLANSWQPAGGRESEGAEGRGLLDEYYTPPEAVNMVMAMLNNLNALQAGAEVLEPTVGTGNFVYGLPKDVKVSGYEINEVSAKIAKMNHPSARIKVQPFEELFIDKRGNKKMPPERYDVVVGNPPYGKHRGLYKGLGEEEKIARYENYFIKRALDLTKDGGYVAMVVPSGFVRSTAAEAGKEAIAKLGELVSAVRLPNGAFDTTGIGTDVLIFKRSTAKDEIAVISRQRTMSDDMYFRSAMHLDHVLGEQKMVKGKWGEEAQVSGTIESAYEQFQKTEFFNDEEVKVHEAVVAEVATTKEPEVSTSDLQKMSDEALDALPTSEITETERVRRIHERKAIEAEEQKAQVEAAGLKIGDEVERFITTGDFESGKEYGKLVKQAGSSLVYVKTDTRNEIWDGNWYARTEEIEADPGGVMNMATVDREKIIAGQWQYVSPTGELQGNFDEAKSYYHAGKYYNAFNYAQGNILAKLAQLETDKATIGEEKYREQKKMLEAVKPAPMTVDRLRIPPYAYFAETTMLQEETSKQEAVSLQKGFMQWLEELPMTAFGESNKRAVRGYVNSEPVRGGDKLQNEKERRTRRVEGDRLFRLYMTEELTAEQRTIVENAFNTQFNSYHRPNYEEVPLVSKLSATFKGKPLDIRKVQRQGLGFLLNKGVGLLAHDVGLGKTMQGIIANIELLERGWAKKPLIVLPSVSVYRQWLSEIQQIKPDIKINELSNLGADFKGDLKTLSIPDGTLSVITEEGFKKLGFSDETYQDLTSELSDAILNPNEKTTKRQEEKDKAKTEETIGKARRGTAEERTFEELGFDAITVDEIHNYNHIIGSAKVADETKVTEFRGFQQVPSQSGTKLWLAAQYIQKNNNGRNVIGLSATPFTNHPLEYYSILSLFARSRMLEMGIRNVNDFMSMYMDVVAKDEVKANGTIASKLDVRGFNNAQQFQSLLREFIDFRDGEDAGIIRPERQSREYIVGENKMSYDYKQLAQELFEEKEAGTLRAMTELQKIAFSPYVSRYHTGPLPTAKQFVEGSPKIKLALELTAETYRNVPNSNHVIYSSRGKEYLPLIKKYLVEEKGFKDSEVQLITGSTAKPKRTTIQNDFNAGKVRVIIGNEAIEEGINLQEKTTDLSILSQPWNFTAVRQVIGRAHRQGNQWKNVRINNFFTENTFDIFLAQTIEKKRVRYQEAQRQGADYIDAGDIEYDDLKTDLMTDPEMKVRVEFNERKQRIEREITREEADFAQKNRKNKKFVEVVAKIQKWRAYGKNNEGENWYKRNLVDAEAELVRIKADMVDRGIDITQIESELAASEAKIEALRTEKEGLAEAETKALEAAKIEREASFETFSDTDYKKFVVERTDDDNHLFLGSDPMFSVVPIDDVTLATLEAIKEEVNQEDITRVTLDNFLARPAIKQVEKDTIRSAANQLEKDGKINVAELVKTVQNELTQIEKVENGDPRYENIALPDDQRGYVADYRENIYQGPLENSAGDIHFEGGDYGFPRYFGHTRTEDMLGSKMQMSAPTTRRILEVQSDLFQKGRLDREAYSPSDELIQMELDVVAGKVSREDFQAKENEFFSQKEEEAKALQPYRNVWWEYLLRHEIKQASLDGIKTLQVPVGKTAMKIEGLGAPTRFDNLETELNLKPEELEVGKEITDQDVYDDPDTRWIITEVLGDGKFKAMPKVHFTSYAESAGLGDLSGADLVAYAEQHASKNFWGSRETFDISSQIDETNPIFKFYERQVGKYLSNNYGAMRVTDAQGVEWWQLNITPDIAAKPIYAFSSVPVRDKEGKFVRWISRAEYNRRNGYVFNANIDQIKQSLVEEMRRGEITREEARKELFIQRYAAQAIDANQAKQQLENFKKRFKLDFDVEVVDRIFIEADAIRNKVLSETEAYAAYHNKSIYLTNEIGRTTASHEFIHLVLDNIGSFETFKGMTREAIIKAANGGNKPKNSQEDRNAEEMVAYGFERYLAEKAYEQQTQTLLQKFYAKLKEVVLGIHRTFGGGKADPLIAFYDKVKSGEETGPVRALFANPVRKSYVKMQTSEGLQYIDFGALKLNKEEVDNAARAAMFQAVVTREELMTNKVFQNENKLNFIMKDINTLEDVTAQARDIYLKDPEQFAQANAIEMIGENHDADKNKLDQFFAETLKPYMKLPVAERARVNELLWRGDDMGQEYNERELINYSLNSEQIAAYKAVRVAMDTAHEMLLREMIAKGVDPVEVEAYREERIGYMPHKWVPKLGKFQSLKSWVKKPDTYVVKWQHLVPETPTTQYETFDMEAYASETEALARQKELTESNEDSTLRFAVDKLASLEVDFFSGLELTQEKMGVVIENMKSEGFVKDHVAQMLKDNLMDMFKEKGFGRHYLRRTGVRGFDTSNTENTVANYFSGFSGYITKMRWSGEYFNALSQVDARRQPQFFNWLKDLIAYKLNNKAEWRAARTIAFAWYLANDISYLLVNTTQNWVVGMGELSKHVEGADKAWKPEAYLLKATNDWALKVNLTPGERAAIDGLLERGQLGAEMTSELMGFKNNPLYNEISSRFNKVMYASTAVVEQNINRVPSFLAAMRIFTGQGMTESQAATKALEVSNDIHFRYGRHHRPRMLRGKVNVLFVFQHYMRSFLYQLYRDASHREFVSLSRKMMYTTLLGGATSLPFAKLLMMIFQSIAGDNDDEELAEEMGLWEIIMKRGIPAGFDIDLSSRVGIEMLAVNKIWENPSDVRTYMGVIGDLLFKRPFDTLSLFGQQRYSEAIGKALPDMFANPIKAYNGYKYGVHSISGAPLLDHNGDVFKYNTWEAIIKATGFTPTHESILWEEKSKEWDREAKAQEERTTVSRTIRGMVNRGEVDEARVVQERAIQEGTISGDTDYVKKYAGDKFMTEAMTAWETSEKNKSALTKLENKLIEDLYNGVASDQQRNNVRKDFATYRQYGLDNEYVSEIMSISTNADKVTYLLEVREEMGPEAFSEFYAKGRTKLTTEAGSRVPILFSDQLTKDLEKAIKAQNATQN